MSNNDEYSIRKPLIRTLAHRALKNWSNQNTYRICYILSSKPLLLPSKPLQTSDIITHYRINYLCKALSEIHKTNAPIYPVDPVAKFNSKTFLLTKNPINGGRTHKKKRAFLSRSRVTRTHPSPSPSPSKWLEQRQKPCKKHLILVSSCSFCQISYVQKTKKTRV